MADNTNKVTIDADYFAELYEEAKQFELEHSACHLNGAAIALKRERDELKAELDDAKAHYCTNATGKLGDACKVAALCRENEEKLAAAERCIEGVFSAIESDCSEEVNKALNIIRAWREKKEAAK